MLNSMANRAKAGIDVIFTAFPHTVCGLEPYDPGSRDFIVPGLFVPVPGNPEKAETKNQAGG